MQRNIIIDAEQKQETRVALLEDNSIEEYLIERPEQNRYVSNIYKGKVMNVVPAIHAAFIDIGLEKNGFIHIDDVDTSFMDNSTKKPNPNKKRMIADLLKEGQDILVQVIKDPINSKGVRLTSRISMPGRFLVLLPGEKQIAISHKISKSNERKRLRELASKTDMPKGCGLIVRTAAEGCTDKAFINDVNYLVGLWLETLENMHKYEAPVLVHKELDLILSTIRDSFDEDVAKIVINDEPSYKRVLEFVDRFVPEAKGDVKLYKGKVPIFEKWGVQKDIDRAFRRKVWLKCGGYIVIDQTEALIAIDVNSGRHVASDNLEQTVTRTNLDAADEIARQLRLRNVGGLVIVDFIDMHYKENRNEVLKRLQTALRKDKARSSILPISEFGLVEMTRQRVKTSIKGSVYDDCPYCRGRGTVKSLLSICLDLQRMIRVQLAELSIKDLRVEVSSVMLPIIRDNIEILSDLETEFKAEITVCGNSTLFIEEVKMYHHQTGKAININSN